MKLFIGNLSWNVTEEALRELFEKIGEVLSLRIIVDQETGRSRGFGFVEFKDRDKALEAIRQLNDTLFEGRPIRVSEAKETVRPPRGNGNEGFHGKRRNSSFNNRAY